MVLPVQFVQLAEEVLQVLLLRILGVVDGLGGGRGGRGRTGSAVRRGRGRGAEGERGAVDRAVLQDRPGTLVGAQRLRAVPDPAVPEERVRALGHVQGGEARAGDLDRGERAARALRQEHPVPANCSGYRAQLFHLSSAGDLVSALADKCVDVTDNATASGTKLQLWTCAGTANQKWRKG